MKSDHSLTPVYSVPKIVRSTPIAIVVVALVYILFVKISYLVTIPPKTISPLFASAGFAFASILIIGRKALIGIFIGSFYSNTFLYIKHTKLDDTYFLTYIPISIFISIGTVIASMSGAYIVNHLCKKESPLSNGQNVLTLLIFGTITYSTITSVIGVVSLTLYGSIPMEQFWHSYKTWWFGDAIGIILITPFILSLFSKNYSKNKIKYTELVVYGFITILLCCGVFFYHHDLKYIIFPLLFWSVYRFRIQITTLFIIIISLFAIISTTQGIGPFYEVTNNDSFLYLDLFLSTITICSLFLAGIISERQKTEDLIKTSENNLRQSQIILESTIESPKDVSIYSIGRKYEYLGFNSLHFINMKLMYNVEIKAGMKLQESISNKKELNDAVTTLDKVFLGENITRIQYFDINESYWEFRTSPIANQNGKIIGATIISTNITEQIKAEEALKKSEEKYRNIFENIQDVIFQTDLNGFFLDLSPSVKDFCGYTVDELIGQPTYVLQSEDEKNDIVITLVKEQLIIKNYEKTIKTKSGHIKTISLSAKIIFDKNERPHHIDAIAQDITLRKQNEKEIAIQNNKLQIQNKELEQFAYITSHDLQEPLLTLKCFSELIKEDFPKDANENINQYLDFILESSDRMQKLVKGLLDYSRIGRQTEITKVDCNEIINDTITSLSDSIKETKTQITVGSLPQIQGYSVELIQLFQQLITNAIKFRKKDIPLTINITSKSKEDSWLFAVEDNGVGVEEHNKEKIFIIFKRLNDRQEYPGIGIGLALCKKIIALHGGNIWIESRFGQGSIIYFTIPKNKNEY